MIFTTTPENTAEVLGLIKGIILHDGYTFHDNLNMNFIITKNKDEFTIDYQFSDHLDEHGESNELTGDSFTVNFVKDKAASLRFIVAMLNELSDIDVKIDRQINH